MVTPEEPCCIVVAIGIRCFQLPICWVTKNRTQWKENQKKQRVIQKSNTGIKAYSCHILGLILHTCFCQLGLKRGKAVDTATIRFRQLPDKSRGLVRIPAISGIPNDHHCMAPNNNQVRVAQHDFLYVSRGATNYT